jgi:nucleoside-diphosphate-sugar epimerase
VAETFIHSVMSSLQGAHVFNLAGDIVSMQDLIAMLEEIHPGARQLITHGGPQVPVAFKMDDSQLHANVRGIPKTPLRDGVERTLTIFRRLRSEGRLNA